MSSLFLPPPLPPPFHPYPLPSLFPLSPSSSFLPARSDRYTHDFVSDEEDGDDDAFQSPFENFSNTAPRFSVMLGQHQLSFDEGSESSSANSSMNLGKKGSLQIEEPKHEKRDSGIAGLEEQPDIKILDEPKLNLLSPTDIDKFPSQDSQGSKGEDGDVDDDDDSTENEEENVITNIDDELSDEDESNAPPTPGLATPSSELVSKLKAASSELHPAAAPSSPPITPTRPQSDFSSLVRVTDHTQSPSSARPLSEHAQCPHRIPGIASRFRRREARMEDLAMLSHDLDITVSPPTPGECQYMTCRSEVTYRTGSC